jgi:hypothetical protein
MGHRHENNFTTVATRPLAAITCLAICAFASANHVRVQASKEKPSIDVQATVKSKTEGGIVLEALVKNTGSVPVYVVTDPRRVDRSSGAYIEVDGVDPSTLICAFQFYPPNPFNPFVDETSVHLMRLEPSTSHTEVVQLSWPLRTTEPPFSDAPGARNVPAKAIKRIEVRVGFLPASGPVTRLTTVKLAPHDAYTGRERIEIGSALKSLYEIQEIARSNPVAFDGTGGR